MHILHCGVVIKSEFPNFSQDPPIRRFNMIYSVKDIVTSSSIFLSLSGIGSNETYRKESERVAFESNPIY